MRFVHISDLHLGKTFPVARYGQLAARRRQELLDTFSRLIDYVNENQVDFILCSGDFLNSEELRVEELRNINAIIDRLQRAVLVAISGNHDPQTENSAYQKIQWSRRLYLAPPGVGRVALSSYKTIITYHSWDTKEILELPQQLSEIRPQNGGSYQILMLHADTQNLGHIHQHQCPAENAFYAGSLEPQDFGETGEHGFMLVEMEGERRRFQFIPFARREYRTIQVETDAQDAEVAIARRIGAAILRQDPRHIYTVELTGSHPDAAGWDLERIEEQLRAQEYCCQLIDNTRPAYQLEQLYRENRGNLLGDFIEAFQGRELTELEQRALELGIETLRAQGPAAKEGER